METFEASGPGLSYRTLLLAGIALGGVIGAALPVLAEESEAEKAAIAYTGGDGFTVRDAGEVADALEAVIGAGDGMVRNDADVSAVEKALLLIEAQEPVLPRVRYMLRYGETDVGGVVLLMVDVRRYNLGPTIREQTIEEYGAENTDVPEAFGVGPHVAWRIAFQPGAKASAMVVAAGRREIPDAEAASADCRARKCLDLDLLDDYADWTQLTKSIGTPEVAYPARTKTPFDGGEGEDQAPAYVALQLAMAADIAREDSGGLLWTVGRRQGPATDEPLFSIIIDRNLGQEMATDAALGIPILSKDGKERWVRRVGDVSYQDYQTASGALRRLAE